MLPDTHQLWPTGWLFLKRLWWRKALDLYLGLWLTESYAHLCSIITVDLRIHWDVQTKVYCEGWQTMMGVTRTLWSHMSFWHQRCTLIINHSGSLLDVCREQVEATTLRTWCQTESFTTFLYNHVSPTPLTRMQCKFYIFPYWQDHQSFAELHQFGSPGRSRWTFCGFCGINLNMVKC